MLIIQCVNTKWAQIMELLSSDIFSIVLLFKTGYISYTRKVEFIKSAVKEAFIKQRIKFNQMTCFAGSWAGGIKIKIMLWCIALFSEQVWVYFFFYKFLLPWQPKNIGLQTYKEASVRRINKKDFIVSGTQFIWVLRRFWARLERGMRGCLLNSSEIL